jgi:hypothetical protein
MKFNNIMLKLVNGTTLSLAQHFDESGDLICNEMAIISGSGVSEPIPFEPNLAAFMDACTNAIKGAAPSP